MASVARDESPRQDGTRPSLAVARVDEQDAAAWDALVGTLDDSTFFHRCAWRTLLCDELGGNDWSLCAKRGGQLVGLLPLVEVRSKLFGSSLTSLPFCSYAGPIARDEDCLPALIDGAIQLARDLRVDRVELRALKPLRHDDPRQDLYCTFRGPIPPDLHTLAGIPQKRRNVVRRAVALGLRAVVERDADRFFELYAENARAHGTPALGRRFFRTLLDTFASDSDVLFVMDASGRDVSAILNFYHRDEVLAYFAGETAAARQTNANDFKYWSLMMHAAARGCSRFDFGRSKAGTGSFLFKRLWGFQPQQLHYEFPYLPSGRVPQNNPMNGKFRLAMDVWRRLPRSVVDRVGPLVVAGLG